MNNSTQTGNNAGTTGSTGLNTLMLERLRNDAPSGSGARPTRERQKNIRRASGFVLRLDIADGLGS
jgi:hypothetical protein